MPGQEASIRRVSGSIAPSAARTASSRRNFLRWAAALGGVAAVAACTSSWTRSSPPLREQIQLVYQDWRTEWFPAMAQQMLARFHADHPDLRVFYTPDPPNVEESLLAEMEAGTAPDVFAACCSFFPILAQNGGTLDLRPYMERDLDPATLDDWDPAQVQALRTGDGLQFGLPKYHGALALFYNKDLFDRYGVDYPDATWDHDDYQEAMRHLTHDQDGDGQIDLWGSMLDVSWERIQVHVNSWGGHFVDPADPTRCLMAAPAALDALEWLRARIWDDRTMASFLDVQTLSVSQAFSAGRVAMVEDGSWSLKAILSNAEFRIGVAPMPAGPARRVTLATTDGFGIYVGTHHPDAAWELLRFLISPDYGRAMARANFLQPARVSLVDEWIEFVAVEFPEKAREMDLAVFAEGQIQGYSVTGESFANMAAARRLAYAAWEQILTLGQVPVAYMAQVCRQIEEAQQRAQED